MKPHESESYTGDSTASERPLDIAMLDEFCDACDAQLRAYGRMIQTIIEIATDQREPDAWRRHEREVDCHVDEMQAALPLKRVEVKAVFTFLAELRAGSSGEPVRCLGFTAASAHMLAFAVMDRAAKLWLSSKETARRSQTDPRYAYPASATRLFYDSCLRDLPLPDDLGAHMALERARARKALREQARAAESDSAAPANVSIQAEVVRVTTPPVNVARETTKSNGTLAGSQVAREREIAGQENLRLNKRKKNRSLKNVVTELWHIACTEKFSKSTHAQEHLAARLRCSRETVRKALGLGDARCPMIDALKRWSETPGCKAPKKFYVHTESDLARTVVAGNDQSGGFFGSVPAQIEDPTALLLEDEVDAHFEELRSLAVKGGKGDSLAKMDALTGDGRRALVAVYLKHKEYAHE